MASQPLPPGCKHYTVMRKVNGVETPITVIAPSAAAAARIANAAAHARKSA